MARLSKAQIAALHLVAKRDWPAGEPRLQWLHICTRRVLLERGLIEERPNSRLGETSRFAATSIIDLTDAGRAALDQGGRS